MATQTSTALKTFGGGFSNETQTQRLTWDYSVDGGEADDTVRIGYTSSKILILDSRVHVETAGVSGGSATLILGIEGGDTDAFLDATSGAVASLTDDSVHSETAGQNIVVAAGSYIAADIATADMTAGKVHLWIRYVRVD
jgi:hypothetical protein